MQDRREYMREYYRKNQEHIREYNRAYYRAHREKNVLSSMNWAKAHPLQTSDVKRRYYLKHLDERRAYAHRYYHEVVKKRGAAVES